MIRTPYEYAILRVIPDLQRGELINAGIILYSQHHHYLAARAHLDRTRLHALAPNADAEAIRTALRAFETICAADPAAGPAAAEETGRRFRWLTAPRSTVVQPGPIHTGLTSDPAAEVDRLLALLVR